MRVAIVSSSVLNRLNRWDTAAVMEDLELTKGIERAENRVKQAKAALKQAKAARVRDVERIKTLTDAGDVVTFKP